jgi:hypothetical protein
MTKLISIHLPPGFNGQGPIPTPLQHHPLSEASPLTDQAAHIRSLDRLSVRVYAILADGFEPDRPAAVFARRPPANSS